MTIRDQDIELAYESRRSLMCNMLFDSKFDYSHSNTGQSLNHVYIMQACPGL
jgi:hypothetical protein